MEEHIKHLRITLEILKQHSLVAKRSKCIFGGSKVEYLGHFISEQGVSTDPKKVAAIQQWPMPKNLKELRGFLGLTGYYRRFIRNYSLLSKPLTSLLKKDAFKWTEEATDSFNRLKDAMVTTPVLALPNMQEEFVVEIDASGSGIGAVLMQNGHPVAYIANNYLLSIKLYQCMRRNYLLSCLQLRNGSIISCVDTSRLKLIIKV
ncbi:hypothetical protein CFOL_v3_07133 [Cephalotus follicularis]|uniref:Reverse transcriptase/retrotransposon-derived protein RNase H-like domain-containing protein n=1 Tax=Cephalotus follicularis TaxID=3775 RepID=A0A1Q3B6T7_CEPFO|nr:hypothetical protein CFOL_v3_07133 [Cephalotus follicularis]